MSTSANARPAHTRARLGAALCGALLLASGCADLTGKGYSYGTLAVTVRDGDGDAIYGVPVDLYNHRGPLAYGTTNAAGRHEFRFVPRNDVAVRAFPPEGYVVPPGDAFHRDGLRVGQRERLEVEFVFLLDSAEAGPPTPLLAP